jgi:Holliday junction DNA helicase RuvA
VDRPLAHEHTGVIATLRGQLRRKLEDRVVLECGGIGYEVFLPPIALRNVEGAEVGEKAPELELVIYYHATRDQPRPVLIGFTSDLDKEFFEKLITVKDIGPMVAARSLAAPVGELAAAIARQDEKYLRALPGIGPQKAKNIVAQLQNKVAKFALAVDGAAPAETAAPVTADPDGLREVAFEVLVKQLGHRPSEASQLIADAFRRRPDIMTAEELFNEIYRAAAASKRS